MTSLQAHIAEHLGFNYRKQIEEKLGVPLPPPNAELSEEVEVQLARLVADAGKQLTQAHQQENAQKQAQQQAEDPVLQLQRGELAVKQSEVQRKAQKDQVDSQIRQGEQQRKVAKDQTDAAINAQRVENEQVALVVDAKKSKLRIDSDVKRESDKLDLEIFKAVTSSDEGGQS